MFPLAVEFLLPTAAAFWIGARHAAWRAVLPWSCGLALIAWLVRAVLITLFPEEVAVSEEYLNGLTVWNASLEIAVRALWLLAWASIGVVVARRKRCRQ